MHQLDAAAPHFHILTLRRFLFQAFRTICLPLIIPLLSPPFPHTFTQTHKLIITSEIHQSFLWLKEFCFFLFPPQLSCHKSKETAFDFAQFAFFLPLISDSEFRCLYSLPLGKTASHASERLLPISRLISS